MKKYPYKFRAATSSFSLSQQLYQLFFQFYQTKEVNIFGFNNIFLDSSYIALKGRFSQLAKAAYCTGVAIISFCYSSAIFLKVKTAGGTHE